MKSLFKVYKSANVTLGQRKAIENNDYATLVKYNQKNEEMEVEEQSETDRINNVELQCQDLIQEAQSEANSILAEAYEDSKIMQEKSKKEGYNEGYNAGYDLGRNEGYHVYTALIDEAKQLKQQIYQDKKNASKELETDLIHLVIESVKKVIQHELEENNELILNLISKAIDKCTFTESLIIRVSEENYDTVNSSINRIYMMTDGVDSIEIKCDKSLKQGSVIIDTLSGRIDASIETQIRQIENTFNELLKSE